MLPADLVDGTEAAAACRVVAEVGQTTGLARPTVGTWEEFWALGTSGDFHASASWRSECDGERIFSELFDLSTVRKERNTENECDFHDRLND